MVTVEQSAPVYIQEDAGDQLKPNYVSIRVPLPASKAQVLMVLKVRMSNAMKAIDEILTKPDTSPGRVLLHCVKDEAKELKDLLDPS